jgi:hypothetical protein
MAAAASETSVTVTVTHSEMTAVLEPIGFARSVVERIVQIILQWSDPSLEPRHTFTRVLPPTPAFPAYLVKSTGGTWIAEWKREGRPAGALLLEEAAARGVPEEEFRAMVHLAWDVASNGTHCRWRGDRERKESIDYTLLGAWIGARLGPGLKAETAAIIAPLYNEPVTGWPSRWQRFRASMEESRAASETFLSMHGVWRGRSGAELDRQEASAAAWRARTGYGVTPVHAPTPIMVGGGGVTG